MNYALLVGRLIQRLGLYVRNTGQPLNVLYPYVVPVVDMDVVAMDPRASNVQKNITGAGSTTFWTVPAGERWRLQALSYTTVASADHLGYIMVTRAHEPGSASTADVYLAGPYDPDGLWYRAGVEAKDLYLFPGDLIVYKAASFTSGGNADMAIFYTREEHGS